MIARHAHPPCRHTLPPNIRRLVIALNVLTLAAKVTEVVIVTRARRANRKELI